MRRRYDDYEVHTPFCAPGDCQGCDEHRCWCLPGERVCDSKGDHYEGGVTLPRTAFEAAAQAVGAEVLLEYQLPWWDSPAPAVVVADYNSKARFVSELFNACDGPSLPDDEYEAMYALLVEFTDNRMDARPLGWDRWVFYFPGLVLADNTKEMAV